MWDVTLDELEPGPLFRGNSAAHGREVGLAAGDEVVEAADGLVSLKKGLEQVGSDKPRGTGDEPTTADMAERRF